MSRHFLEDNSGLNFQSLFPEYSSDNFNFLPDPDVPAHVSLQVHAPTTSSSSGTQIVNSSSTIAHVDAHWDGITFAQSGGYYPPDNALAAGAHVVITAENDAIQITDLQGGGAQTESLNAFFSSVMSSGYFLSDPRVLYDPLHHDFVVAVDEVSNNLTSSNILLAVSTSDLATPFTTLSSGNWQFEAVSTTHPLNGTTTWADQPLVSVDGNNIYVSTNQFSAAGAFEGSVLTVLDDGLFTTGGTSSAVWTAYANPSYQTASIAGGGEYLVSDTHNSLSIFESNGGANTNPVSVMLGTKTNPFDFGNGSYSVSQSGTSYRLDAGDGRITSAAYDSINQKLWVVFEGQPSGTNTTPSVLWAELDMTYFNSSGGKTAPTVLNTGNLNSLFHSGPTAGAATFNGSVAIDGNGDVLFNFNVSGSHMYPADYFTYATGADKSTAAPTFVTPIDYHDSVAAYVDPNHDRVGRWGDYSTAIADPNAPNHNGFYISNEFDNGKLPYYSTWGTAVDHILV
jgi:hypothetical protein